MSPEVRNLMAGQALVLRALGLDLPAHKKPKPHPPKKDCVCLACELANAVREGREAVESDSPQVKHDALFVLVTLLEQNKYKPA
jgi:hypothetical protein